MKASVRVKQIGIPTYFEFFYTGFFTLLKNNVISQFNYQEIQKVFWTNWVTRKVIRREKVLLNRNISTFVINFGNTKKTILIDTRDTPWEFDLPLLTQVDLYFKAQYPRDLDNGYFFLNQFNKIPIDKNVMKFKEKIKPLMLGRPLSRRFDFKKNLKLLDTFYDFRKNCKRTNDLLSYLGNANDSYIYDKVHHPHIKRLETMLYLNKIGNDNIKIIFKPSNQDKIINEYPENWTKLEPQLKKITDQKYFELIRNSKATLNIMGLRGSIPFRFIDAFLSGMLIFTDNFHVDWYVPLRDNQEVFCFGDMGYEVLSDLEKNKSYERLKKMINNIDSLRSDHISYLNDFYETYLAPEKVARYIIDETEKLCS